jgi:hypothetical protein
MKKPSDENNGKTQSPGRGKRSRDCHVLASRFSTAAGISGKHGFSSCCGKLFLRPVEAKPLPQQASEAVFHAFPSPCYYGFCLFFWIGLILIVVGLGKGPGKSEIRPGVALRLAPACGTVEWPIRRPAGLPTSP